MKFIYGFLMLATHTSLASNFEAKDRDAYIETALQAVSTSKANVLADIQTFVTGARSSCRSKVPSLEMQCLLEAENSYCLAFSDARERQSCGYSIDIVMNNMLSERAFLTNHERYKILKNNHRGAGQASPYRKVLMHRYAHLVTEMVLWQGMVCPQGAASEANTKCLSKKVSSYCQAKSAILKMPWQACSGAMIWFIGNQGRPVDPPNTLAIRNANP